MDNHGRKLALLFVAGMLALGLVALVWATGSGSSRAQQDAMHNCPQAGKWAIAVWDGADGTEAEEALDTCGEGAVAAAYSIDPDTQMWSSWFAGQAQISNLTALNNLQGILALGGAGASAPAPAGISAQQDAMQDCPQAGKWAISVWSGDDATDAAQGLATCGTGAVAVAYSIDPDTQMWSSWFAGQAQISTLTALNNLQGILALGSAEAPATPVPSPTLVPSPTPAPSPTPTATPIPAVRIAFVSDRDGNDEIYVMNADGSDQTRLTKNLAGDWQPKWSPDGSQIVHESDRDDNGEVYVMNADGTGQTNLTENSADDRGPAWSPDGSQIAFVSERDGNGEIYVMNADGTDQTRLTNNQAGDWDPVWSPDGSQIAFESERNGKEEVYVMNADGTGQTNLTENPAWDSDPAWSPDGSQIAFESDRGGDYEIYAMNADGTDQTNITKNSVEDYDPAWSPDGSRIAFASTRDGDWEVYVMNVDGTDQTNLTKNPADDYDPAWSP